MQWCIGLLQPPGMPSLLACALRLSAFASGRANRQRSPSPARLRDPVRSLPVPVGLHPPSHRTTSSIAGSSCEDSAGAISRKMIGLDLVDLADQRRITKDPGIPGPRGQDHASWCGPDPDAPLGRQPEQLAVEEESLQVCPALQQTQVLSISGSAGSVAVGAGDVKRAR